MDISFVEVLDSGWREKSNIIVEHKDEISEERSQENIFENNV